MAVYHFIWLLLCAIVVTNVQGKSISMINLEEDSIKRYLGLERHGVNGNIPNPSRVRRSDVVDNHWNKTTITYRVLNGPHAQPGHKAASLNQTRIEELVAKAFAEWAPFCGLSFQVWNPRELIPADITLSFHRGWHFDEAPFDGPGKKVAHSSPPLEQGSQIHFDDDENWVDRKISSEETKTGFASFYSVALHEIGHVLGLGHSFNMDSIMNQGQSWEHDSLGTSDVTNIRNLYAKKQYNIITFFGHK